MGFKVYIEPTPSSGSHLFFRLKEAVKQDGWIVYDSGGGFVGSYGNGTDVITNSGSNRGSWWAMHSPTGAEDPPRRDFMVKLSDSFSSSENWLIQYTEDGVGFVSGSPTATVFASASAPITLHGSTLPTSFTPADGTFGTFVIVGGEEEGYSFFGGFILLSTGALAGGLGYEFCTGANPNKIDPSVVWATNNDANWVTKDGAFWDGANVSRDFYAAYRKETRHHRFLQCGPSRLHNREGRILGTMGTGSISSIMDCFPIYFWRDGEATRGGKQTIGRSRIFRQNPDVGVTDAKTFTRNGERAFFHNVNIPWENPLAISSSETGKCRIWIRGDDYTLNDGGGVNLPNRADTAMDFGQSGSTQPTLIEQDTEFNTHAAIGFALTPLTSSIELNTLASSNGITIFTILRNKNPSPTITSGIIEMPNEDGGFGTFTNSGSVDSFYTRINSGSNISEASASFSTYNINSGALLTAFLNRNETGTAQNIHLHNRLDVTEIFGSNDNIEKTFGTGSVAVGFNFSGGIAEIIVYDHILSSSERQRVEGYLYQRYIQPYGGV